MPLHRPSERLSYCCIPRTHSIWRILLLHHELNDIWQLFRTSKNAASKCKWKRFSMRQKTQKINQLTFSIIFWSVFGCNRATKIVHLGSPRTFLFGLYEAWWLKHILIWLSIFTEVILGLEQLLNNWRIFTWRAWITALSWGVPSMPSMLAILIGS